MTHGSVFTGGGGFDLAATWMGWDNIFHCEINPFCQRELQCLYPEAISYGDIKAVDFTVHRGHIDILTGGFPCQPYSTAGKRLGKDDSRHLWPEMLRAIREIRPGWVLGENVRGLTNWNGGLVFDQVQADLETEGYEVTPFLLPACAVNAPHRRDRIWFIAHRAYAGIEGMQQERENRIYESSIVADTNSNGQQQGEFGQNRRKTKKGIGEQEKWQRLRVHNRRTGKSGDATNTSNKRLEGTERFGTFDQRHRQKTSGSDTQCYQIPTWDGWPTQPPVCRGNDGFSTELLRQRIRADCMGIISEKEIDKIFSKAATAWAKECLIIYGNAIVPQVALNIFEAIEQYENLYL